MTSRCCVFLCTLNEPGRHFVCAMHAGIQSSSSCYLSIIQLLSLVGGNHRQRMRCVVFALISYSELDTLTSEHCHTRYLNNQNFANSFIFARAGNRTQDSTCTPSLADCAVCSGSFHDCKAGRGGWRRNSKTKI